MNEITCKAFADANSNPEDWDQKSPPVAVYLGGQARLQISLEQNSSLGYMGRLIGYLDENYIDYGVDFANGLLDAIRDDLSANHIQKLMLRLAEELSAWQLDSKCPGRAGVINKFMDELGKIKGYIDTDEYKRIVIEACGEMSFADHGLCLRALVSQQQELATEAARYKKLRKLNVAQFKELFQRNITTGTPFDQLVDEL